MEVKLIAMTDVMYENEPAGSVESAEQVCNHAAKTCTKEDAGDLVGQHYIVGEPCLIWEDNDLRPLERALASGHESILEHAVYTFEVKGVSRALTHQLVRHRVASYSQQSQRYVRMAYSSRDPFDYVLPDSIKDNPDARALFENHMRATAEIYGRLVDCYKLPMEDARYILPNACMTNIVVTMNARELLHFFSLRCCERAQWEIRELADKMLRICKEVSPTIFANAGPFCVQHLYCPEQKGCGKYPKITDMYVKIKLDDSVPDCKTCKKGFAKWEAPEDD